MAANQLRNSPKVVVYTLMCNIMCHYLMNISALFLERITSIKTRFNATQFKLIQAVFFGKYGFMYAKVFITFTCRRKQDSVSQKDFTVCLACIYFISCQNVMVLLEELNQKLFYVLASVLLQDIYFLQYLYY